MSPRWRPYYGWIVVATAVPVLMLAPGMRSAPGAWLLPMRLDHGFTMHIRRTPSPAVAT